MTEEELRQFDKEVLIKFIVSEAYFGKSYSEGKLKMIQRHHEVDCLLEKRKKLSERMSEMTVDDEISFKKWKQLLYQENKIDRKINELLSI